MFKKLHNPLVSVNIITYNRQFVLVNAIESALNQSYKNIEIIVVDDGSTDNTSEIIEPYKDKITYIKLPKKGKSYCRQYAKNVSKGEYFAFLDSDDTWNSTYIEKSLKIMKNQNLDLLFTQCEIHAYKPTFGRVYVFDYSEIRTLILHKCPAPTSGMIVKKGNLKGFKWEDRFNINEDWHLQIRLIVRNIDLKVGFNPMVLWDKNEDDITQKKLQSLKYIIHRKKAYKSLYIDIKENLNWIGTSLCWLVIIKHNMYFIKRLLYGN